VVEPRLCVVWGDHSDRIGDGTFQHFPGPRPVTAGPEEGYRASGLSGLLKHPIVTGFVPKEDLPKLYRNAAAFLSVSLSL
jgi:hypothetical protein